MTVNTICVTCDAEMTYYASKPGYVCKRCASRRASQWAKDNPEKVAVKQRRSRIKIKYGLTEEQVQEMYLEQLGTCPICETDLGEKFAIDHDHDTGMVRGLLCHPCNRGLGSFRDDIGNLARAIQYLTRGPHA